MTKPNLLINLPPRFFTRSELAPYFDRLAELAELRKTSHNTQEEILRDLPWADGVIMWAWPALDEQVLNQAPRLRFVGQINTTQTTAKACLARGIAVTEVRRAWSPAVAEMALALILAGLRKTSAYHMAMRQGTESWVHHTPQDIDATERELTGLPVGIVGFGGIGQRLAELLAPFHVELFVYDPYIPDSVLERFGAKRVEVIDLIRASDVVVLCAANQPEAEHMIGRQEIEALRKNAVLVNVGRSMLVDMQALLERLQRGDLIALLDVFDTEPLEPDSPLRPLPNAFLTPHRAGGLISSLQRALDWLVTDYEAFLNGKEMRYAVTEEQITSFAK